LFHPRLGWSRRSPGEECHEAIIGRFLARVTELREEFPHAEEAEAEPDGSRALLDGTRGRCLGSPSLADYIGGDPVTDFIAAVLFVLGLAMAYVAGRLHQALIDVERDRHLPYRLRAGLDDLSAVDTDMLLWIKDALALLESRAETRRTLMGQIRNGEYDPEQAAAPRRVKLDGRPK
jgi:hypothetical protein